MRGLAGRPASLKTRLRVSIAALVTAVAVTISALSLRRLAEVEFQDAAERAQMAAAEVGGSLEQIVDRRVRALEGRETAQQAELLWASIIKDDPEVSDLLLNTAASSRVILEILIADSRGTVLASSDPNHAGAQAAPAAGIEQWRHGSVWGQLSDVLFHRKNYELAVQMGPAGQNSALFSIRVVVSSVLLRNVAAPALRDLALVSLAALAASILLGVLVSNLVFRSLARVGQALDRIAEGGYEPAPPLPGEASREMGIIQSKLNLLGERFRGAKEDAERLRSDIEHLLINLDEAVLLFDGEQRLIMASQAAERLLGMERGHALGHTLDLLFPPETPLGRLVHDAIDSRTSFRERPLEYGPPDAPRLTASVEVLEMLPGREFGGALVTLRDAESRRKLQSRLDVASRLAAISRLTEGAAHEIKNPLNAIALHMEVLKAKADSLPPDAQRETEVIAREIARLNRVVKTFLDFSRPVRPKLDLTDAAALTREVAELVQPHAEAGSVSVIVSEAPASCFIEGDRDLLKQALLNVVMNGIESMKPGGKLDMALKQEGSQWVWSVADEGCGIPPALRERIYNLYTTTKENGSGIGLAIAFRVAQLHNGTIDFASEPGRGTTFFLRFPSASEKA